MASPRAIGSGVISCGLVSIPFRIYSTASVQSTSFNMLHERCKCRCKQQFICPTCQEVVERIDMIKGYEYAKDQYVTFTEGELKSLQAGKLDALEIVEFVPEDDFDVLSVEKSYFLGPDKGGEKSYQLFARAMREMEVVGVGRHWTRGKVQLVLIQPYRGGLILHYAFYENERRSFEEIVPAKDAIDIKEPEIDLARRFIGSMTSPSFRPGKYRDEYEDRVRAAVELKVAGKEVSVQVAPERVTILDVFEALKRSISPEVLKGPPPKPKSKRSKK